MVSLLDARRAHAVISHNLNNWLYLKPHNCLSTLCNNDLALSCRYIQQTQHSSFLLLLSLY